MKDAGRAKIKPAKPEALFLPYQERWIRDSARLKLMEKARQIGLSWATSYRRVRETGLQESRYNSWVSSRDEAQALLFLEDCKAFAQILQLAASDYQETLFTDSNGNPFKAFVHEFANGKKIHSMSSNPNAQAGKRGSRTLDEFALHMDPRKLYAIAYPGITWGGQMEIISTHRGNLNFFAELVREIKQKGNPKRFSLHTVTLQDALDQGFLWKLQQKLAEVGEDERLELDEAEYFDMVRRECPDEETFLQEFMCEPADDKSAFLEWDLIAAAEFAPDVVWEVPWNELSGDIYIGVDVGRRKDLTVMWVLEDVGGVLVTRKLVELSKQRFAVQRQTLYEMLAHPRTRRCCIDETGLGMQLAEEARDKFGYLVEPVQFTAKVKEQLAYPLRVKFEERSIKIPERRDIRADLRGVKKDYTAAGNVRFTADSGPDGHSDRFWALALAVHAKGATPALNAGPVPLRGGNPLSGGRYGMGRGAGRGLPG